EGDGEIAGLGRVDLDGQRVVVAGPGGGGDVEFKETPGAGELIGSRDLLAVEPDVGAEVDAVECQPERLAPIFRGQLELGAEPPRLVEGAVGRHGRVGEVESDGVDDARRGAP